TVFSEAELERLDAWAKRVAAAMGAFDPDRWKVSRALLTRRQSALDHLSTARPNWVEVSRRSPAALELSAAPVRSSGRRTRHFSLTVREIATGLVVREKDDLQHLLPRRCPQRHINAD